MLIVRRRGVLGRSGVVTRAVTSPDGTKTARLRTIYYYDNQPSYKIYWRETGKKVWLGLHYLPANTNTPKGAAEADLAWNQKSDRVDFLLSGTSVWHHVFSD